MDRLCLVLLVLVALMCSPAWATIDITMAELEYVANHISQAECRRLVAALHDQSYELDPMVPQAGLVLPDTVPCIELLVHWNSSPGEGRGKTHEVVSHRLHQLGHAELATWLSKNVFHQLASHLEELEVTTVDCSHNDATLSEKFSTTTEHLEQNGEELQREQWSPLDSVWLFAISFIVLVIIILALLIIIRLIVAKYEAARNKYEYDQLAQA